MFRIASLVALLMFSGAATTYGGTADYKDGNPLYCDCRDGERHIFQSQATEPWVAVDVALYQSGQARCGDELWLYFPDGTVLKARAYDAGYLNRHWTIDNPHVPIVVDVPVMFAPFQGTSLVRVANRSAAGRILEEMAQ